MSLQLIVTISNWNHGSGQYVPPAENVLGKKKNKREPSTESSGIPRDKRGRES